MEEEDMVRHWHWGPRGTDQRRGRVVLVDEHRTSRVSSGDHQAWPLHSLTQPLVLGTLVPGAAPGAECALVAAAVHNLTQACSVPVRIKELRLNLSDEDTAAEQRVKLQQLVVGSWC
ncbi:hypothetical protein HaLaN_17380 [Haematococcus lacustris]|uniref:Uncharacterized protein n=1 Tax=Haematococcus lacustris TaxID=44745 RepID=A0A699ZMY1_HAELA|nr:hypothetical protein HaLaN_17380 [Haematococcus lacustris]